MTAGDPTAIIPTVEVLIARARMKFFKERRGVVYSDPISVFANAIHGEIVVVPAEVVAGG